MTRRTLLRLLALGAALAALVLPACAEVNQQGLADVAAGKVKVAKASWWGYDAADATKCLQAAIDSKVPKLVVDNVGSPWIVLPLRLVSNQEIEFEKGVELLAKRGAYLGTNDSLLSGNLAENVTLRGYGATLRMWRADYDAAPYQKGEWRHAINLHSCRNITVLGLTITETGGDGIYLGTGKAGVSNVNILIKDVVCDKNYRQGISVITAENLTIEDTVLSNTAGTAPQAGIDFEPNGPGEQLVNCVMRGCKSFGNAGCGYVAYIPTLNATSAPVGLRLENCSANDNASGAFVFMTGNTPAAAVKGTLSLVNCTATGGKGAGFTLNNNPPTGLRVAVDRCTFADVAPESPSSAPICFLSSQAATEDIGGVKFTDCVVRDKLGRKPMAFVDSSGGLRIAEVSGNLILEQDGKKTRVELTEKQLGEWMPALTMKRFPRMKVAGLQFAPLTASAPAEKYSLRSARLRNTAHYVLYARAGDTVTLKANHGQLGKYGGKPVPLIVTGPDGKEVSRTDLPFMQETEATFQAPATGLYQVDILPAPNYVSITASSHPLCLSAAGEAVHFCGPGGTLYFYVPAGTKEFGLKVYGEGTGEGVKATLLRPDGTLFGEQDDIAQAHQFEVALPGTDAGQVWCLKLVKATHMFPEDNYVDVLGLPPFLAPSPEAVLAEVK